MNSLHILEIKPLSKESLINIFSHTVVSIFILLMFSLAVQKFFFFISMKSHFFILSFMSLALELTRLHSRKTNNPIKKIGKSLEQTLLQGGHAEGPETYEKMYRVTSHQRDAN